MKKFFAIAAAALLLLTLVCAPVSASAPARFYLVGPSSAKVGDTIEVSLMLEGDFAASTMNLRVFFDNTSFRVTNKTLGSALTYAQSIGGFAMCDVNMSGNAVSVGLLMTGDPLTQGGELVKITLEVIGTASADVDFGVQVEEFTYLPLGQTIPENIGCTTEGIRISIQGGTGSGTTPMPINTPRPEGTNPPANVTNPPSNTAGPIGPVATPQPNGTENSGASKQTSEPEVTPDPKASEVVADETEAPVGDETEPPIADETEAPIDVTAEPDGTAEPTDPARNNNALKTGLIIGGCALAAAAAALAGVMVYRKKNKKQ